jgi:DNA-binding FadR family transcriptional regulator
MLGRMALKPVARRLVPENVFDQLLGEVVDGELAAGDSLPSERRLAEVLGVSRPAVREALQRLSHARVVEVRHGGSTTVRDFRRFAGLDLLPRLLVRDGELDPAVGRSILQARQAIAPAVAAQAAETAGAAATEVLRSAVTRLEQAGDS